MASEEQEVAKLMRNGTYFKEAHAWYQTLYIRPISERSFFLVIGLLAGFIGVCGVLSFMALLPIHSRPLMVIASNDIESEVPSITRLRTGQEPVDPAMRRFFLSAYVSTRESYSESNAAANRAFVLAHSDPATVTAYLATMANDHPQNPVNVVGAKGRREVEILDVTINDQVEPPIASVRYYVQDTANGQSTRTTWLATVGYYYTPLILKEVVDKDSGETIIATEEPQFQVVQYERQPIK